MVEQGFCKAQVASSNLVRGSQCSIAQSVVREAVNFEVLGSSPSGAVKKFIMYRTTYKEQFSYIYMCLKEIALMLILKDRYRPRV